MMDEKIDPQSRLPTRSLEDLVVPRRPSGIPYVEGEDYDAQALLSVNGYSLETAELIQLLASGLDIFRAAAARTLGARGDVSSHNALLKLAQDVTVEDSARVQAAYALVRLGHQEAVELLANFLEINSEISIAPLQAAGSLARLGDSRGYVVIRTALESSNRVIAMVACKQLIYLEAVDGQSLPGGGNVGMIEAFRVALSRPEAPIRGEAITQLIHLNTNCARSLLKEFENRE